MPKAKRRKNIFGFGRKSSANYIPASGGIAKHAPKHRAKSKAIESDSKYDDVAKSLAGKPYKSLSSTQQATVRGIASKMNPKRLITKRRTVDTVTGKTLKHHNSGLAASAYARKMAKKTGHAIEVRDEFGKQFTYYPDGRATNPKRKRNISLGLPKNQFVNAKVRMKGGKIQVMADERVLGKAGFKAGAGLSGVSVSGGAKLNPSGKRYRGIITAKAGKLLLGGGRRVVSSWFETRKDAADWIYAMKGQPNYGSSKIVAGKGRIDIGKGGSWVR